MAHSVARTLATSLLLATALVIVSPAVAQAQVKARGAWLSAPEASVKSAPRWKWYGWQTLAVDTVAIVGMFTLRDQDAGGTFALGYVLASPMVHLVHDHGGRGAASLVLRTLPLALMVTAVVDCEGDCDDSKFLAVGLGSTTLVALFDGFLLGYERVAPPAPPWTPAVTPAQGGGATLGVAGTW
jgi:hypothetical protein